MDVYDKPQFRGGVLLTEMSTPAQPASGTMAVFAGTDNYLYYKDDSGNVVGLKPAPLFAMCQTSDTTLTTSYATYASGASPVLTVTVPSSGIIECTFGLAAAHSDTGGSQVYVDMAFTGANSRTPSDTDSAAMMFGAANTGIISVEKTLLLTGLTPGSTTITMKGRTDLVWNGVTGKGPTLYESWLLVQPIP